MTHAPRTHGRTPLAVLVAVVALLLMTALPAQAQDDPYGSTSTTQAPTLAPSCRLGLVAGAPGTEGEVTVENVPPGGTVRIIVDGREIGRATAPQGGAAQVTLVVPFEVPDISPGSYPVSVVGANFTITCVGANQLEVLAASEGLGSGGGSLPRTGVYVALLVAIAVALLLLGRLLLEASRRKRERAARAARATGGRRRSATVPAGRASK